VGRKEGSKLKDGDGKVGNRVSNKTNNIDVGLKSNWLIIRK